MLFLFLFLFLFPFLFLFLILFLFLFLFLFSPMTMENCVNVPRVPLKVGGAISPKYTGT